MPTTKPDVSLTDLHNDITNLAAAVAGRQQPLNLKQEVRGFLGGVNPYIPKRIDRGDSEIGIFLGIDSQSKLSAFSKRPGFEKLLTFTKTSIYVKTDATSVTHFNDFINEEHEEGQMTGFILFPKEELRANGSSGTTAINSVIFAQRTLVPNRIK